MFGFKSRRVDRLLLRCRELIEYLDGYSRSLDRLILGILTIALGFYLYIICFRLNVLQIDHAGHIASMVAFSRGWFHSLNDQHFLGWVHNLFYPPLEDALGACLLKLGFSPLLSYKIYLSLVIVAFLSSFYWLLKELRVSGRILTFLGIFFLLNIEKNGLIRFQGLSFVDMWLTGLSSQMLSGIFFFCFLKAFFSEKKSKNHALLISLTLLLLSHLVMALVAVLLVGIHAVLERNRKSLSTIGIAFLLGSFFWLPFLVYKSNIVSAMIYGPDRMIVEILVCLVGIWISKEFPKIQAGFISCFILFGTMAFGPLVESWGIKVPVFHYYRFAMPALFILLVALGCLITKPLANKNFKFLKFLIVLTTLLNLGISHRLQRYSFLWPSLTPVDVEALRTLEDDLNQTEMGRSWILHTDRPTDFGLDSLLAIQSPNALFSKGLFWESAKSNSLVSSYLATLLGTPVVLDYFYFFGYDCPTQACLMDTFSRTYNVDKWIFPKEISRLPTSRMRQECYEEIIKVGQTQNYLLNAQKEFQFQGQDWQLYRLISKTDTPISAAEVINFKQITPISDDRPQDLFSQSLKNSFDACQATGSDRYRIQMGYKSYDKVKNAYLKSFSKPRANRKTEVEIQRIESGSYKLNVSGDEDALVWIKLNAVPGLKLFDRSGKEHPLFEAYPGVLAIAKGSMTLEYRRPLVFWISYLVSGLTFLFLTLGYFKRFL